MSSAPRPIEFVGYDSRTRQFKVNDEALEVLRSIRGPVGVIGVCGRAREGKSYLLNQLLGHGGGFKVASTQRPCTKGLWIWSRPMPRESTDGNFHIILLDTEGVDAYDQTRHYSTQVFCLAVLLSSLVVFNHMGVLTESSLERLSLVCETTKRVRVRATSGPSTSAAAEGLEEFAPAFIWLLRDFYLDLRRDQRALTPKEYMEEVLAPVVEQNANDRARNEARASIRALFPNRDCAVLVRPVSNEDQLVQLDTLNSAALRPEFVRGIKEFTRSLDDKNYPKTLGGVKITGAMLGGLAVAYVKAINEGAVPNISTAWQAVTDVESRKAMDEAERVYENAFDASIQATEAAYELEHQRCVTLARQAFDETAVGNEAVIKPYRDRLMYLLKRRFQDVKGKKLAEAAALMESVLMKAISDFTQKASRMNISELDHELRQFVLMFERDIEGPDKWKKLCKCLMDSFLPRLVDKAVATEAEGSQARDAHQKLLDDLQVTRHHESEQREEAERKYRELEGRHGALMQTAVRDKEELEKARRELQSVLNGRERQTAEMRETLDQLSREKTVLTTRLEQAAQAYQAQQEASSRYDSEITRLKQETEQLREGWNQERASTERRISQGQAEMDALRADVQHERRTSEILKQELNQHRARQGPSQRWRSPPRRASSPSAIPSAPPFLNDRAPAAAIHPEGMTINELKEWLMSHDYGQVVWEAQRGAQPRKADWVKLVKERL